MTHDDLLKEALDPATDPERLRDLARHKDVEVRQAVWKNPSVPEDVWRTAFLGGWPEAWDNPMAPIYVLTWTPHKEDFRPLGEAALHLTSTLWIEPKRCSPEGKALLAAKMQEEWSTSALASDMITFLGWWARIKGDGSVEHREVVRILVLCVRTMSNLTKEDRQALDLLKAWSEGGADRRKKARDLADSEAVKDTVLFARNSRHTSLDAIQEVLIADEDIIRKQAMLADLIRRNKPMPPLAW
jgi:hypothetical protein